MTKTALVTGVSSGIGHSAAAALTAAGWRVIGTARVPAPTSTGATLALDLRDRASILRATEELEAQVGAAGLAGLVANAGIAVGGPLELLEPAAWREQFEVNVFGTVELVRRLLPAVRRARGRIVFVGSISGRVVGPGLGPYAASKAALAAIASALRQELAPWGIAVSLIEPGPIRSEIWAKGRRDVERAKAAASGELADLYAPLVAALERQIRRAERQAEPAAATDRAILHALDHPRPRARYLVGRQARLAAWLRWLLTDAALERVIARIMRPRARRP